MKRCFHTLIRYNVFITELQRLAHNIYSFYLINLIKHIVIFIICITQSISLFDCFKSEMITGRTQFGVQRLFIKLIFV